MKYRFLLLWFLTLTLSFSLHVPGQMNGSESDPGDQGDSGWGGASFLVIVNPDNHTSSMPKKSVSRIFMKKMTTWEDGTEIIPVDQVASAPVREEFSRAVHKKSASSVANYWQKMIFSGRGAPPLSKPSDRDVIEYVKAHKGAIGYVSPSSSLGGVKVLDLVE